MTFSSAYAANASAVQTILGKEDIVVSDQLNHASIIDAVRVSGVQNKFAYKHSDMADLEAQLVAASELQKTPKSNGDHPLILIITDGVFSMDGDLARLPEIVDLAKKYDALTMVDDAHGEGVLGNQNTPKHPKQPKAPTLQFPVSSFQFPVSSFQFPTLCWLLCATSAHLATRGAVYYPERAYLRALLGYSTDFCDRVSTLSRLLLLMLDVVDVVVVVAVVVVVVPLLLLLILLLLLLLLLFLRRLPPLPPAAVPSRRAGHGGRGVVNHFGLEGEVDIEIGSLSKAFSVMGGFIAAKQPLIDAYLMGARQRLFSIALTIPDTAALLEAVEMLGESEDKVQKLWSNVGYLKQGFQELGFDIGHSETPIIPVMLGDEDHARAFSARLFEEGVFASAICFPMVPRGYVLPGHELYMHRVVLAEPFLLLLLRPISTLRCPRRTADRRWAMVVAIYDR